MVPRWLLERVHDLLGVMPAVFIQGARQVGKTTLATQLVAEGVMHAYFTLDDLATLQAAQRDPIGFVDALPERSILDEVQRVPELLLPLKRRIDASRKAGMFLLTGSASPLTLPQVADVLVGRMAVLTLYPFSQGEIEGVRERWVERAFEAEFQMTSGEPPSDIWARILRGGYPEAVSMAEPVQYQAWLRAYADTLITRDVRLLADIERVADMGRLLQLLAAYTCQLLNVANLSREMGVPHSTLQRYLTLLETLMIVARIPPWHANIGQQLLKTPKVMLNDTGLALAMLNVSEQRLISDDMLRGRMLENFVAAELTKQISYSGMPFRLYHLRTGKGREVDFVIEDGQGRLLGIEVKASATVGSDDFRHLRALAEWTSARWAGGIVLYLGGTQVPFGDRLWALPVSSLWQA